MKLKKGSFIDQVEVYTGPQPNGCQLTTFYSPPPVKALTWKQPYAELMFFNKVETRSWNTKYRGWVLICAGKTQYTEGDIIGISGEYQAQRILTLLNSNCSKEIIGMAIGIGYLANSFLIPGTREDVERTFVGKCQGKYGFEFENVKRIKPFLFKGGQRWKNLTEEEIRQIIIQ